MKDQVKSRENSNHYNWGSGCSAWQLINRPGFYVVEEIMPSGASEIEHHHNKAKQFFYVLEGVATFTLEGKEYLVKSNEGIFIEPGSRHRVANHSDADIRMLIISSPPSLNDRYE